jgi:CHAT domain-containing protein
MADHFFDTIDDDEVGRALVDHAAKWLKSKGMKRMSGPFSLYPNEEVGVLVEGFDTPPMMMMAHSRAWQDRVALASGLVKEKDVLAWRYTVGELPKRASKALDMLKEDEYFNFVERSGADAGATRMATSGLEQDWLARYQAAGRQAAALEGSDGDDAFQAALDELRAQMRKTPAGAVAQSELAAPSRTALRRLLRGLGRGVVLLQAYHVDDRLVTIVTSAGTQTAQVTPVDQRALNRQIFEFRRELRDPRSNPLPSAQSLYQLLLAPVAGHLERIGARTVMLSLDGPLRYLPFGALHDGQRYALERWALPLYTAVAPRQLLVAPTRPWHVAALGVTRQLAEFAALPGVDAELARIVRPARSQPQSQPSTGTLPGVSYLNEEFTAQRLRDVGQQRHPVLHVATHFKFNPGTESASFLLLGDGTRLTLGELRAGNFRFEHADLMTLSACDTGLGGGRDAQGQEIEGLGVIVQRLGAKSVLASLWAVDDRSTGQLMADFYRQHERDGLNKIEALRRAQLALRQQRSFQHPFYWAPFIQMGNWR